MADMDDILLGILRQQLGCAIPEDIISVRLLSTEMLVEAVAKCLRSIDPETGAGLPVRLSAAMATKYRQASLLAEACKSAGYSGEVGYEAFLYGGEGETRKLLMFLVDKLPKDDTSAAEAPVHGDSFVMELRNRLREEMERPWLPFSLQHYRASRHSTNVDPKASVFRSQKLAVPLMLQQALYVPVIPVQCSTSVELASSVIEFNAIKLACWNEDSVRFNLDNFNRNIGHIDKNVEKPLLKPKPQLPPRIKPPVPARRRQETTMDKSVEELDERAEVSKDERIKDLHAQLQQLSDEVARLMAEKTSAAAAVQKAEKAVREGEDFLSEFERTIAVKEAIALASSGGSRITVASVTTEIDDLRSTLADLHEQWDVKKASLHEGVRALQNQSSLHQNTTERLQEEVRETKQAISSLHSELNEREEYLQVLQREYEKLGTLPTRASYTRRILEIVASIKKQKLDIDKIIKDTRVIQKEINTLSGRLERAFIEIDELMFRDAKNDEFVRRAYKCVAMFHETCAGLIRTVESTGVLMRESKDLEDEAAAMVNKKVDEKLQNVLRDLEAVRKENVSLEAARHGRGLL